MVLAKVALLAWVPASLWLALRLNGDWPFLLGCSAGLALVWAVNL